LNSKFRQNHYFYLLIALLVQLIAYPFLEGAAGKGMAIMSFPASLSLRQYMPLMWEKNNWFLPWDWVDLLLGDFGMWSL